MVMLRMWAISFAMSALLALMAQQVTGDAFVARTNPALVPTSAFSVGRGGATVSAEDEILTIEEESDEEEESEIVVEDDEDEEEENTAGAKLAAATVIATTKTKSKAAAANNASIKTKVNEKLASSSTSTKKKNKSLMKILHIPYILRACLNPITLFSMTKAYWASLMNLDYLKKADASQDLRSALEEKAKKGGSAPAKGRRKMKRGQAKTLSDLPQLNT